jgi:hypothetical protein
VYAIAVAIVLLLLLSFLPYRIDYAINPSTGMSRKETYLFNYLLVRDDTRIVLGDLNNSNEFILYAQVKGTFLFTKNSEIPSGMPIYQSLITSGATVPMQGTKDTTTESTPR